jgi:hypothetical protein
VALLVTPTGEAGPHEQVGHALLVGVVPERQVVGRPDHVEQREHVVLLQQLLGVRLAPAGVVAVVLGHDRDVPPLDPALLRVQVLEEGVIANRDLGKGGERP